MEPSPQHLADVLTLLNSSLSGQNGAQTTAFYDKVTKYPDYIVCLLKIVSTPEYKALQNLACILLRQVLMYSQLDPSQVAVIIIPLLKENALRSVASNLLSTLFVCSSDDFKFKFLQTILVTIQTSNDLPLIEGMLSTLSMIIEDDNRFTNREQLRPLLETMFECVFACTSNQLDVVRKISMETVVNLSYASGNYPKLLKTIIPRAKDTLPSVRISFCQIIANILLSFPEVLKNSINDILNALFELGNDPDVSVRTQALGLWGPMSELYQKEMAPNIMQILQLLITKLPITDEEVDTEYSSDADEVLFGNEYSERKVAGISLDQMASNYGNKMITLLLPFISQKVSSPNWKEAEAVMFLFGCVVNKGWTSDEDKVLLGQVRTVFMQILSRMDNTVQLQFIVMWCVQRVQEEIVNLLNEKDFETLFKMIMQLMVSTNNKVRFQALCTLSSFLDYNIPIVVNNVNTILPLVMDQIKPPAAVVCKAIDTISIIVDVAPVRFEGNKTLLEKLIALYIQICGVFPKSPDVLDTVIYNISYIFPRFGDVGVEMAFKLEEMAVNILKVCGGDYRMQSSCILLLSSCIAVNPTVAQKIFVDVFQLIIKVMAVFKTELMDAVYSLLADFMTYCTQQIQPHASELGKAITSIIQSVPVNVSTNLYYCLSVMLHAFKNEMVPYHQQLCEKFVLIMKEELSNCKVQTRACILLCFSLMGEVQPNLLTPLVGIICKNLIVTVPSITDKEATCSILFVFGKLICANPVACESALLEIVTTFNPNQYIFQNLKDLCVGVRNVLRQTFNRPEYQSFWASCN
ncbi:hypothetical protein EIN_221930 [Entamoeba invadens IP1]|uniref:HEAT repeat domain containing protein n=1 Tax=Entamoeba invadens IP1 TaxID=370355 RepID=A0A0A1U5F0_ENTIV|nr:hypothetical protein EIN_221930 [Entamoeba invadens IP1]ELP88060.1 hypothetical protein EIN_221930 [Entamoeba invadens IP1]|eukprot:XP_004254831.1 hypothetical protein EIN_221930 [Entamoeba invadens IP1]